MVVLQGGMQVNAMTLQQLRGACAVADTGFNVTRAAAKLHTTQSAISKTVKALEHELGAAIFVRSSVRMTGLTEFGQAFMQIARSILHDAEVIAKRAQDDANRTRGLLTIGTTHHHATYSLPNVIRIFRTKYPQILVHLEQADPPEIARWVSSRRVQVGIAGFSGEMPLGLITLGAMRLERCIVVPVGHELTSVGMPTMQDIARYPVVAHDESHPAGIQLRALFRHHGLELQIAATAPNATILKEYVAAEVGIAILPKITIRPKDEDKLATIAAPHLFPSTETKLVFRQGEYLRPYVYDFAEAFSPQWSKRSILEEIERQGRVARRPPAVTA
jgi:LysR family cys regulon transcriptional activator